MIIQPGSINAVSGVHLNKIYKTSAAGPIEGAGRRDAVSISRFSALVERARACAMALPDVRADRVAQARHSIEHGESPETGDIAAAMINRAAEGQV